MAGEDDLGGAIFGWVGTVLATYFYIAPIVPYLKLIKGQLTYKEVPGILLLCSLINCVLWSAYALLKNQFNNYLANGLGGSITLIYVSMFLIYFAEKKILLSFIYHLFLIACVVEIYFLCYYIVDPKVTGIIANIFNVLMYAAPGEKIKTICETGNYELIPIFSTIGGMACSTSWMLYGFYQKDPIVITPNALGVTVSIVQIVVYIIYRNKMKKKKKKDLKNEEESEKVV